LSDSSERCGASCAVSPASEALFATAIGLAAAIPAVIFYNQANVLLGKVAARMTIAVTKYAKLRVYGLAQEQGALAAIPFSGV